MGERIATATAASALIGLLVALGTQQAQAAPANKCLSAPNGASPNGLHWHYHLDRAKNRKCWYLRAVDATRETAVSPVDTKKAQAERTDSARMPGSAAGDTAYAGAAVPAIQMNAPGLPRSAEPSELSVAAEDNQPSTPAVSEVPEQPAPQLPQADAEAKTGSAAGAAMSAEKKELVREDVQSSEPSVPSTTSRGTFTGTAIVIAAASVLGALAIFILMLARRRRPAVQDVPLPDQAPIVPKRVATAGVLSEESARLAQADFSYSADSNSEPLSPESETPVARDIVAKLMTDWLHRGLSPLGLAEAFVDAGLLQITRERGPRAAAAILQEFTGSGPRIDCTDGSGDRTAEAAASLRSA